MVWFALSLQGQVEKYGAYIGIAAFFGLAVLSLLYFSQARELKRLREWAGRAPERAHELEQRVVAQATATVARRAPAMPGAPAKGGVVPPPRRLAEMPPPTGTETAAVAQATQLADAVEADPATNGNVPAPPRGPGGSVLAPPANGAVPGDGAAADPDVPAAPVEAAAAVPARAPGDPVEAPEASSPDTSEEAVVAPGEVPAAAAVPRVTPAQRVGVTPRPEPLPLRQSKPSAVPPSARAGAGAGRRAAAPDARRSATKPPREGRSAGTIALIVGLVVLILGGGAFVVAQLAGGDKAATPPNQAAPPPTQSSTPDTTADATPAPPAGDTNVAVLNGTTFNGLAGQVADRVAQEGGYQRGITETNTRDQTLQSSTVFYADGFRGSARAVAKLLSIDTTKPLDADTQALAPDADVVILAGADQAP